VLAGYRRIKSEDRMHHSCCAYARIGELTSVFMMLLEHGVTLWEVVTADAQPLQPLSAFII